MITAINQPRGVIGALSVGAAALLLLAGIMTTLVQTTNVLGGDEIGFTPGWFLLGLVQPLGVLGFALAPRTRLWGGVLSVAGGIALAACYFWAVFPLVIGPLISLLGGVRAAKLPAS